MRCKIIWSLWASPCQLSKSSSRFPPPILSFWRGTLICVFSTTKVSFFLLVAGAVSLAANHWADIYVVPSQHGVSLSLFFFFPSAFWYHSQAACRLFHGEFTDRNHSAYSLVLVIGGRGVANWRCVTKMCCESWRKKKLSCKWVETDQNLKHRGKGDKVATISTHLLIKGIMKWTNSG